MLPMPPPPPDRHRCGIGPIYAMATLAREPGVSRSSNEKFFPGVRRAPRSLKGGLMNKEARRARVVALFILLMFTVGVYFFWSYNEDIATQAAGQHVEYTNGHIR